MHVEQLGINSSIEEMRGNAQFKAECAALTSDQLLALASWHARLSLAILGEGVARTGAPPAVVPPEARN